MGRLAVRQVSNIGTPEELVALRPDIWRLIPLAEAKGAKKPSAAKLKDKKTTWSGGPWGSIETSQVVQLPIEIAVQGYAWRYTTGKARLGFYGIGRYAPDVVVDVAVLDHMDEYVGTYQRAHRLSWEFIGDMVAVRDLLPEMVPPKPPPKPKVAKPDPEPSDDEEQPVEVEEDKVSEFGDWG